MISHLAISLYFIFAPGYSFPLIFVDFCILGATTYNEFPAHFVLFWKPFTGCGSSVVLWSADRASLSVFRTNRRNESRKGYSCVLFYHRGNRLPLSPTVSGKCSSRPLLLVSKRRFSAVLVPLAALLTWKSRHCRCSLASASQTSLRSWCAASF